MPGVFPLVPGPELWYAGSIQRKGGILMKYEPWMLAVMEEAGYMDTKEGQLNRLARYLVQQPEENVGNEEFLRACRACHVDYRDLDHQDLRRLQEKLDDLS